MAYESQAAEKLQECLKNQISVSELSSAVEAILPSLKTTKKPHYFSVSINIPKVDVLAVLEQHNRKYNFQYYWEKPMDEYTIAAAGSLDRVQSTGAGRFRDASTEGKELLSRVHHFTNIKHHLASIHLLGGFSFFDHNVGKEWRAYGAGSFTLPEWLIVKDGKLTILTVTTELSRNSDFNQVYEALIAQLKMLDEICRVETYSLNERNGSPSKVKVPDNNSLDYKRWIESVENATDLIKSKQFHKIVLARDLKVKLDRPVSDTHILNYLRIQYPDCYSFLIRQNEESSFIGCTPERLASFQNRFVLTEGLAGSISRGKTASEDAVLEHELLHSQKDLSEHSFVLEAIQENLTRFSEVVEHPSSPEIKKLSNVQHLYTPVRAKIRKGVSRTEVLAKLHPTPAVGGYPRDKAMPYINKLEYFDRGWYAAPVGWINANGEGEFVVAIRSGLIKKDEVRFFAGCGIVEDSDPEKEWEETKLKFIPMLTALEYART